VEYPLDPAAPSPYPPGSEEKLACLELRAALKLPLFLEGDAQGTRHLAPRVRPDTVSPRSERERLLVGVLNGHDQTAKELALLTAIPLHRVRVCLDLLREAGVVETSPGGWRLTQL
jgi:hypothetical protein